MSDKITKYLTIKNGYVRQERMEKILAELGEKLKNENPDRIDVIVSDKNLKIVGKVEVHSVLFDLDAHVLIKDQAFRIKFKTNAPLPLSTHTVSDVRNCLEKSLREE